LQDGEGISSSEVLPNRSNLRRHSVGFNGQSTSGLKSFFAVGPFAATLNQIPYVELFEWLIEI
jgi:hypothetical protein